MDKNHITHPPRTKQQPENCYHPVSPKSPKRLLPIALVLLCEASEMGKGGQDENNNLPKEFRVKNQFESVV